MNMIHSLLSFLDASPASFLAVARIEEQLAASGFRRIDPSAPMPALHAGDCVYVTKNDSALFAFRIGSRLPAESGFKVIGAHCDSPTFRIKPSPVMLQEGKMLKLNTEVYGSPILSTWFDRPLSLAGRVMLRSKELLHPAVRLLHIRRPLLQIPSLAIHFNRGVNEGIRLSRQKDMLPVLGIVNGQLESGDMLLHLIAQELRCDIREILDFDLYLYDTQPACLWGMNNEFISSGRLDDLSMVHAGLQALLTAEENDMTQILAVFDNEETGSGTKQGAASPVLRALLERLVTASGGSCDDFWRAIERSFMVSADNAHAWHPNYPEKYDPTNHPVMGGGPVIKFNASQKYASDADSAAVFAEICRGAGVPCQRFVNHSDVAGGSTLGNILTAQLPWRGVDMGNPIWAMHSVRESASVADHEYCIRAFRAFYDC